MNYALRAALQMLVSIPLCVAWMAMYGLIVLGWGVEKGDSFIMYWHGFVSDEDLSVGVEE